MSKKEKRVRKTRTFKPRKTPRLCPYQYTRSACKKDLDLYNGHLKRVFEARPKVDAYPSKLDPEKRIGLNMEHDARTVKKLDIENKKFLKRLIEINRTGGRVDHLNTQIYCKRVSQWRGEKGRRKNMMEKNRDMLKRLHDAKSAYSCEVLEKEWKINKKHLEWMAKFPLIALEKISLDEILRSEPTISNTLGQLGQRHQCFLDFRLEDGTKLGRIVIVIYADHVPVTATNFLQLCGGVAGLSYKNCAVHRIVKNKFMESGDITKGTGTGGLSVYGESFDEENHNLKHTKAGVVSMVRVGNQQNDSKFAITFVEMQEWDRKNVVFGKVVDGAGVLMKINGYGRKIGKPLDRVFISNCGVLSPCGCL